MSLEFASFVSKWSNISALMSLVVGVVAAYGIWHSSEVKEEALKRDLAEANRRIAEADARAAEANYKAESERLERLKLEKEIAPRRISPEQKSAIVAKLSPLAGKTVSVVSYGIDADSGLLKSQIVDCLLLSRISVPERPSGVMAPGRTFVGLQVGGPDPVVVATLRDALAEAGGLFVAPASETVVGWDPMTPFSPDLPLADASIFVGVKPPIPR